MPYVYSTRNGRGDEVEQGSLRGGERDGVFHLCQTLFGPCVGSFSDCEDGDKSWVFARCTKSEKGDVCLMRITSVWEE